MKLFMILGLILAGSCHAAEIDDLVKQLTNEDYDIRQTATDKLSKYPEEYIERFYKMSLATDDPELRSRLRIASQGVFYKTRMQKNEEWLFFHGYLGLEGKTIQQNVIVETTEKQKNANGEEVEIKHQYRYDVIGYIIEFISEDNKNEKIEQFDMIIEINGEKVENVYGSIKVKADSEYKLKIRRFKDKKIFEQYSINVDGQEHEEDFTVTIKAKWKEDRQINLSEEFLLADKLWKQQLESLDAK